MKRREWMKVMMPLLAFAVAVPAPVMAADTTDTVLIRQKEEGAAAEEGQAAQSGPADGTQPGTAAEEQSGETPEEFEERTGYILPEGWEYVLDGNGQVILQEDGLPVIQEKADQEGQPGESEEGQEEQPGESGESPSEQPEKPSGSSDGGDSGEGNGQEQAPQEEEKPSVPETEEPQQPAVTPEQQVPEEPAQTNEELVAAQQIMELPVIKKDFRFWTVARKYAFAKDGLEIMEGMEEDARAVGKLEKDGVCYILKEEENGWLYVESGRVRGFVKAEQVLTGEAGQKLLEKYQKEAREKAEKDGTVYAGISGTAGEAEELIPWLENEAFTYLRATAEQTVIAKKYAVCNVGKLNIREGKGTDSRIVGTLSEGSLCYILADEDQEWIYVESGDVRGFVKGEYLVFDEKTAEEVEKKGEETFTLAEELVKPEENKACYYTLTSIKTGIPQGEIRQSLLDFASQFIGNPYVWGGTSLTEGADCSGFAQSIYKAYGYDLPRTSREQSQFGTKIPVEDAQPGDLIFYAKNGVVYHVVIYAGDGKTIEAMSTSRGIVQGNVDYSHAVWATRVLEDTVYAYGSGDIAEVNADPSMYGEDLGEFRLTYYCACEICCDVETGITATGAPVIEGRTIAVDPSVIPYGTQVIINGHIFTAEDCGGAIKGNRIDIYVNSHDRANELGVDYADVYLLK